MADENEPVLDLLGDPWTKAKDPRGRKAHKRQPQLAEMVALLLSTGSKEEEIALRIGLSVPTLKKYYFRELRDGSTLIRQMLIARMWKSAMAGNVSATKWLDEKLAKGELAEFIKAQQAEPGSKAAPRPAKLGKKEEAALAAASAGEDTPWGSDLAFDKRH
jgi:hypothetical protein